MQYTPPQPSLSARSRKTRRRKSKLLQLDWGLVWLPRSPSSQRCGSTAARFRDRRFARHGDSLGASARLDARETRDLFSGLGSSATFHFLSLFPHPVGRRLQFFVFPTHQLHLRTRIDRGELSSVAVMRPRLRLAARDSC